jgi:cytochrome c oxidase subunit IV
LAGIIILPFMLVLVLIWLVLIEGGYTFDLR